MPHPALPIDAALTLLCHPATPAPVVRTIAAHATIGPDGSLTIAYRLAGDIARLLIPETRSPEHTDSLWEHTCFEAFVGAAGDAAYREFNFSPSGQWATYAFSAYRQPDHSVAPISAPRISARRFAGRLELEAMIAAEALPFAATTLQIGLSAVVEASDTVDGSHSYWALHHPAARPDFHQRAAFILELNRLPTPRHPV